MWEGWKHGINGYRVEELSGVDSVTTVTYASSRSISKYYDQGRATHEN